MWTTILAAALLAGAPAQQNDTTFAVDPHGQLRVEDIQGDVAIRTWDRPQVRVATDEEVRRELRIDAGSSTVRIGFDRLHGSSGGDLQLTIPATMALRITGSQGDVDAKGLQGEVAIEVVNGSIELTGGRGLVTLRSVNGDIQARGVQGHMEFHTVGGDLEGSDLSGDLVAASIGGDVQLNGVQASDVQASTVSGDVSYEGTVRDGGHYVLSSHSGDVVFAMPEGAGATITVNTFSGDFDTAFPVRLTEQRKGQRFSFGVGSGSARVDLQSFSGDISLARHGAAARGH